MGLRINTNISSLTAQRNLGISTESLTRSLERLSSGLRITRASDDAAGLAISERLRAEVRAYEQAQRNALDGISLLQVAEGALNEVSGILVRLRELAIQSANGTVGTAERVTIDAEFQDLVAEIDRVAAVTEFNGTLLLDGELSGLLQLARAAVGFGARLRRHFCSQLFKVSCHWIDPSFLSNA